MTDIDELKDSRTKAQKIGDVPANAKRITVINGSAPKPTKHQTTTLANRAKRHQVRDLALDYAEWALLEAVNIGKTCTSPSARIDALKLVLNYALGRPSTVHVDIEGQQLLPNLIIISGDGQGQTIEVPAQYTPYEETSDEDVQAPSEADKPDGE
jgi:hypothetical protein